MDELVYNRQYLLCDEPIDLLKDWDQKTVGDSLTLYVHPNLDFHQTSLAGRQLTLVGDLFDPHHPKKSNTEILKTLANKSSFNEVITATFDLAGKFILIYHDNNEFTLFHDPAGLREVFYLKGQPNTPCASQPTLFAEYKNLQPTADSLASTFYSLPAFHQRKERILDTTQYEGLFHLQPNCYLDLRTGTANRYFPNESLTPIGLEEAVDKSVLYLKGIFESMENRYQLMIAVTAGIDSRVMLAASRQLTKEIFYFILNSDRLKKDSLDITTPQKLLDKMGLPFHILEQGEQVSETIKTTLLQNVELMLHRHFNFWYNVFFPKKGYLNITSVSEFARNYYHYEADPNKLSGDELANLNKFKGDAFASEVYSQWLTESQKRFKENGYNTLDMFYWEEKMGNWLANGRSSMGSVIEDFSPFNCRNLMITFLAVDEKYRGRYNSVFHKKIIEKFCPEALQEPINGSRKYQVINALIKLGIYPLYKRLQLLLKSS